jgi:hypothetical protein
LGMSCRGDIDSPKMEVCKPVGYQVVTMRAMARFARRSGHVVWISGKVAPDLPGERCFRCHKANRARSNVRLTT